MKPDANAVERVFRRSRVFLPVIHPVSKEKAFASIQTAVDCEADGIFLINQGMSTTELLAFIPEVHRRYGALWIGINLFGLTPEDVIGLIADLPVGGIWSDNAGIDERSPKQPAGERFSAASRGVAWDGLYFGGVAFKYQREVSDGLLPAAA